MKACSFGLTIKPLSGSGFLSDPFPEQIHYFEQLLFPVLTKTQFQIVKDFIIWTNKNLPMITWSEDRESPRSLRLLIFFRECKDVCLSELILPFLLRRLAPGTNIVPRKYQLLPFVFEEIPNIHFFACDVHFPFVDEHEKLRLIEYLSRFTKELAFIDSFPLFAEYVVYPEKFALLGSAPCSARSSTYYPE